MNNRRKLVIALGMGALSSPFTLHAQPQTKVWRLGFLAPRRVDALGSDAIYGLLLQGMREFSYVEGKNLVIELRSSDGQIERLPALAAELVQAKVDVIVTSGSQATSAAQKATGTIPIVMGTVADPVGSGFVKTLAHPEGNITGLSNLGGDIGTKHLEFLLNMVPKLFRVAVLVNSTNSSNSPILKAIQAAARTVNVKILPLEASNPQAIENAFSIMVREKVAAVIVAIDGYFVQQRHQLAELTLKYRMPSMFGQRAHVEAGGLMSYGQNLSDNFRRAAAYVDKIFKGAKPGDLPVEQSTTLELYINGKTAKALGIKIPNSVLVQATKVIE
jgi:putative ABC transport system substrate-binding protein